MVKRDAALELHLLYVWILSWIVFGLIVVGLVCMVSYGLASGIRG